MSIRSDWQTFRELKQAIADVQPDVILAYTIKPIIWGGIAARYFPHIPFFGLVTGLGYAFAGNGWKRQLLNRVVATLYRRALARAAGVIFQNADNQAEFLRRGLVRPEQCQVVSGSGINLARFTPSPLPAGAPQFLLIARLLGEKGIREYAAAAELVRKQYPEVRFSLVGPTDPSPDGIKMEEVDRWVQAGTLAYLGATSDVRPFIADCHIYCLPSYHEGMPRTVLEAMAMGRPILTTDVSGCRETVVPGDNGWLVPAGDAEALAERMIWFVEHRDEWARMGAASRQLAENRFDVVRVNAQMLKILGIS